MTFVNKLSRRSILARNIKTACCRGKIRKNVLPLSLTSGVAIDADLSARIPQKLPWQKRIALGSGKESEECFSRRRSSETLSSGQVAVGKRWRRGPKCNRSATRRKERRWAITPLL